MSQALSTIHSPRSLIVDERVKKQLADALPSFYTPEQFLVCVRTAINKNPKLEECTGESFMVAMLQAAQMGVPVDGRYGHLIPRRNRQKNVTECQFQADYKGLVRLVRMNDDVTDVYAVCVHEKDDCRMTLGLHRDLIHVPPKIGTPRGEIIGAYAVLQYKNSPPGFEFMDRAELERIRDRSDGYRAFKSGNASSSTWVTDEGEMFKKTVIKRLLKLANLSPDTAARIAAEPIDIETTTTPVPSFATPRIATPELEQLPAPAPESAPVEEAKATKRRVVKLDPTKTMPAPVASPHADDPLPGVEADPQPATTAAQPASAAARLRAQHPEATDAQILAVLVPYGLATAKMTTLEEVPTPKLVNAIEDPESIAKGIADPSSLITE